MSSSNNSYMYTCTCIHVLVPGSGSNTLVFLYNYFKIKVHVLPFVHVFETTKPSSNTLISISNINTSAYLTLLSVNYKKITRNSN